MDPYEQTPQETHHTVLRLRSSMMLLHGIVRGSIAAPNATEDSETLAVQQTKSSRIATFVRDHPRTPRAVRIGLAVLGLASLAALLVRKRFGR